MDVSIGGLSASQPASHYKLSQNAYPLPLQIGERLLVAESGRTQADNSSCLNVSFVSESGR
jgi:hypothetical protein